MPEGDEISFYLPPGFDDVRGQRWLVVRLAVGLGSMSQTISWPTARRTTISQRAFGDLAMRGLLPPRGRTRVLLREPRIEGQPVPDVVALVSATVGSLGIDGILGLDFFEQFEAIHWYPRTRRVVLVDP